MTDYLNSKRNCANLQIRRCRTVEDPLQGAGAAWTFLPLRARNHSGLYFFIIIAMSLPQKAKATPASEEAQSETPAAALPDNGRASRPWHPVLRQQLEQHFGRLDAAPTELQAFLEAVNEAYHQADNEQAALKQHVSESARELLQTNAALTALNDITRASLETPDLRAMLQLLADRLGALFEADACYITLWDEARQLPVPTAAYGHRRADYPNVKPRADQVNLTASVLAARRALVVEEALHSPYLDASIALEFQAQAILALPLIAHDEKLGAAIVVYHQPHSFNATEVLLGERVAGQAALAVAKARALDMERQQRQLAEVMREAGAALTATLDFNAVLDRLLEEMERVIPYDSANIMLVEAERGRVRIARMRGYEKFGPAVADIARRLEFEIAATPILRRLLETRQPVIIPDPAVDPEWIRTGADKHVRSWASAPIVVQGEVIALFAADKGEPNFYRPEHVERLNIFAGQAALALQNARLFEAVRQQAAELEVVRQANLNLTSSLELPEVLDAILRSAIQILPEAQVEDPLQGDAHIFLYDGALLLGGEQVGVFDGDGRLIA